jgi:predicted nuclease of predicted toxin-antitoxin system
MKLLLDQGVPRSVATILRAARIDTVHVGEIGYATAEDAAILQRGEDEARVVVTFDADFHMILALSGATTPSVIRIRIAGLRGEAVANLLQTVIDECEEDLEQGAAITVQEGRIRIRRLPLVSG